MTDRQRNVFILALVVGLIAASIVVIATKPTQLGLDLKGGVQLVYQGEPTPQTPVVTPDALSRAVDTMRQRVDQLGVSQPSDPTSGGNQITAGLPNVTDTARAEQLMGTTARLAFYDWEANALTPSGKPVSSLLTTQDPNAVHDQPGGRHGLAGRARGRQHAALPGGAAGVQAADVGVEDERAQGPRVLHVRRPGQHRLRGGRARSRDDPGGRPALLPVGSRGQPPGPLRGLPTGVSASEGQVLTVPQGWVVLQAVTPKYGQSIPWGSPNAQYFVLRDNVALFGNDITNPQESTDQAGSPDVHVRVQRLGRQRVPERHLDDRPPR